MLEEKSVDGRVGTVFYFGLFTGFFLLCIGGGALGKGFFPHALSILTVCAGLGVILGAFGSVVSVKLPIQGATLTGVAAITVALFGLVLGQMDDKYLKVKIGGDVQNVGRIEFIGETNYLGAYQKTERSYDFIIFGKEIKKTNLELYVYDAEGKEIPFKCIPSDTVSPHLASGKTIEWEYRGARSAIYDVKSRKKIADVGSCEFSDAGSTETFAQNSNGFFSVFPSAYAQDSVPVPTNELVIQLKSDVPHIRRDARNQLAEKGIDAIEPLLEAFTQDSDYRTRLGVLVALSDINNTQLEGAISEHLNEDAVKSIVDAVDDQDKTIRVYASEFLIKSKDPRVIELAIDKFNSASMNGRFNYALIVKNTVDVLSEEDKTATLQRLKELKSADTPKINRLIDSALATE